MVWCGVVWCGVVQCGVVWCGVVRYGMVWYGTVRYGMVRYGTTKIFSRFCKNNKNIVSVLGYHYLLIIDLIPLSSLLFLKNLMDGNGKLVWQ